MNKAVLLDKDGTLIVDIPYNVNPKYITLTPGALRGLQKMYQADFKIVIITNQQGIELGYYTKKDVLVVKITIENKLADYGIKLSGFYYCPHADFSGCLCRKPNPGLIKRAARELQIDVKKSWMIGDTLEDLKAGKRAGCQTILFDKGYENIWEFNDSNSPNIIVKSLDDAADYILKKT